METKKTFSLSIRINYNPTRKNINGKECRPWAYKIHLDVKDEEQVDKKKRKLVEWGRTFFFFWARTLDEKRKRSAYIKNQYVLCHGSRQHCEFIQFQPGQLRSLSWCMQQQQQHWNRNWWRRCQVVWARISKRSEEQMTSFSSQTTREPMGGSRRDPADGNESASVSILDINRK